MMRPFVGKLDRDPDYDPDKEPEPQWSPFGPDGYVRDLETEGWHYLGLLSDDA